MTGTVYSVLSSGGTALAACPLSLSRRVVGDGGRSSSRLDPYLIDPWWPAGTARGCLHPALASGGFMGVLLPDLALQPWLTQGMICPDGFFCQS